MSSPSRAIFQAEAIAWLRENPAPEGASVITSMPDVSEMAGRLDLAAWRAWFVDAARTVIRWVPATGVAIFFSTDIRHAGVWIDKGHLVVTAAEEESAVLLWHKIVCRRPPGTLGLGRPTYAHMICVAHAPIAVRHPGPEVLADAGPMSWSRAMGLNACRVACAFLRDDIATRVVVDPFCGRGGVLAVANAMGMDAIGVDLGASRCRAARACVVEE